MSDTGPRVLIAVVAVVFGLFVGALKGIGDGRELAREHFLTFCTEQNIPYAKCKEEWKKR